MILGSELGSPAAAVGAEGGLAARQSGCTPEVPNLGYPVAAAVAVPWP